MRKASRVVVSVAAGLVVCALSIAAEAQDKKKKKPVDKAPDEPTGQSYNGRPSCYGLLFIGSYCGLPNGKFCYVGEGTSGIANLRDCK
jgi:hypothetical protein